jgi:hypothetical protein
MKRPEEVTDFRRSLNRAYVLSSSADESIAQHLRMTRMTINIATRIAEAAGMQWYLLIHSPDYPAHSMQIPKVMDAHLQAGLVQTPWRCPEGYLRSKKH